MSETQTSQMAGADWSALRQSAQAVRAGSEWTASQYATLVDLINHADQELNRANRYHLLSIGGLIPILAILLKLQVPLFTYVGLMFLGVALGVRWLTLTSKLNLEKLCWISLARQVEKSHFADAMGPYSAQQAFFSGLPDHLSSSDRFIMRRLGTRRLYFVSVILVAFALIAAGLAALASGMNLPF